MSYAALKPKRLALLVVFLGGLTVFGFFILARVKHNSARAALNAREEAAVLRGFNWLSGYMAAPENFDYMFGDYVVILNEMTMVNRASGIHTLAKEQLLRSIARAQPRLKRIYANDQDAKWEFIALLQYLHKYGIPMESYLEFYNTQLPKENLRPGYDRSFKRALRLYDYDSLSGYLIDYSFLHFYLQQQPDTLFDLPANEFPKQIKDVSLLKFIYDFESDPDGYHDQNYYITHVIMVLNNYGELPLEESVLTKRIRAYLLRHFHTVRHEVGDLDLLAEFVYCLRVLKADNRPEVEEAIRYLLSEQHADGSWGTTEDFEGDAYDVIHPTWTVISALNYPSSR